jgi:zinc protease
MKPILRFAACVAAAVSLWLPAAAMDVQVVKSPGGIEAWLVEQHGLPIISLQAGFDGGARLDPEPKTGLAYLTSTLMNEGAGDYDSTAFAQKLDDKAINFGGSADSDAFYLSLTTLSANKADAFEMMRLAIASPRFDQEAIDRMKAQIYDSQKEADEDPNSIAGNAWAAAAFPGHPYGRKRLGTAETIGAITRDDIVAFTKTSLGRDQLKVVVVGDITAAELGPLLDTLFAAIPEKRTTPDVAPIAMQNAGKTDIIDRDIPQSVVVFGAPGIEMTDPGYRAAQVMNYVLGGGGFASRLMQEVRSKRGLTYGISTGLAAYRLADIISGSVASDNAKIKEALDLTKAEIEKMRSGGISDDDLVGAKAYLTGSYALRFDSNGKIASTLLGLFLEGFDKDYINRRNAEIEAVTKEEVAAAAQRLLDPAQFYWVVVGKPVGLQ